MQTSIIGIFLCLILAPVAAFEFQVTAKSSLSFDVEDAKNRPVSKVIELLKSMQAELEKEAEEDEEIYEKLTCWCDKNDKEKTKAIADAEARIKDLTTSIEELTGASSRLNTEKANLEKEKAANQAALDKAAAIRTKELAEFNEEEKDVLQSIGALRGAIAVLAKHHGGAFLQLPEHQMSQVKITLQHEMDKHADLLQDVITPHQRKAVAALLKQGSKDQIKQQYAPASGEIFGILKGMLESFESNLAQSRKDEEGDVKSFVDLKASKEEEIAAGTEQIEAKTQELATTDEKLANDKQDLDDTEASLSADEKFLMNLKETCAMTDSEWEQRTKERQLEIEAVSKALAILSSDDAHDQFSKTFNFMQKESTTTLNKRRSAASKLLTIVASKTQNPRLSALAVQVKLDAFKRVIKAIDDMISQLTKEKEDEIKHRDYCIENLNNNEKMTEQKDRDKKDLIALIEDLTVTINELTKAIETLKAEIAEMQVQLKHAGEDRELANQEFQTTVADQRATQKLLKSALDVLKAVYAKKMVLAQQEPPTGFKEYKKNKHSGGVMGMIQSIIDDAKALEKETIRSEEQSQKAYEDFVKESNASIEEKSKEIVNKSEEKAQAEDDRTKAEEDKADVMLELEQLSNESADLHKACDFVLKNFEIRQTGRDEEIEALKQAKAILSGAKFKEFLDFGA
jgi:chromosome segregation ATPase